MPNNNYFYHHGIEGQKWGKRNGPPYPLQRDSKGRVKGKYSKKQAEALQKEHNITDDEIKKAINNILWDTNMSSIKEVAKLKKTEIRMYRIMNDPANPYLYKKIAVKNLQRKMNTLNDRGWKRVYDEALTSIIEERQSKNSKTSDNNPSNKKKLSRSDFPEVKITDSMINAAILQITLENRGKKISKSESREYKRQTAEQRMERLREEAEQRILEELERRKEDGTYDQVVKKLKKP